MLIQIIFWLLIAIDLLAVGLFFVLGLAAAGPSHTSSLSVAAVMLLIPGALLLAAIVVFLAAKSPLLRGAAFLLAASPLLFLVYSQISATTQINSYKNADGTFSYFKPGPMRDVEAAIARNDAAAIPAAAKSADLNEVARDGSTVLIVALEQLKKSPGSPDVLRALLRAGASPNPATGRRPLSTAILLSPELGPDPVKALLDAGANPNQLDDFRHPVHFAATGPRVPVEVLRLVLDRGADLKLQDPSGVTALLRAAVDRNWKAVLLLLERGADPSVGRTPMGLDFRSYVESAARDNPSDPAPAEVLRALNAK